MKGEPTPALLDNSHQRFPAIAPQQWIQDVFLFQVWASCDLRQLRYVSLIPLGKLRAKRDTGRPHLVKEADLLPISQQVPIAQPFCQCGPPLPLHKATAMFTVEDKRRF